MTAQSKQEALIAEVVVATRANEEATAAQRQAVALAEKCECALRAAWTALRDWQDDQVRIALEQDDD